MHTLIQTLASQSTAPATAANTPLGIPGVAAIAQAQPPWRWRIAGSIFGIAIDPCDDPPFIEARVADGTGWLVARWRGRDSLRGLGIRETVILEGFVERTPEGHKQMFEPDVEILPSG